jgi:hypothetical protein
MDCCSVEVERNFLVEIITGLQKLVAFVPGTHFGGSLKVQKMFDDKAEKTETAILNLKGTVALLYVLGYKEPWPEYPTPEQQIRIDEIYEMLEKNKQS